MSTATLDTIAPRYRVTGPRVLRAEWSKLWTLRSTGATFGIALAVLVGFGLIAAGSWKPSGASGFGAGTDPVQLALRGIDLVLLAVGALGVTFAAGEYSTGMIRSTMATVPKRLPVLWSKAALAGVVGLAAGAVGGLISYVGGQAILHGTAMSMSLTAPGVLRSIGGAAVCMALIGVLGVALGSLLRSIAGGITTLVVLLMMLPLLSNLLPSGLKSHVTPYLLGNAESAMYSLHHVSGSLSPWGGLAVLVAWVVPVLAAAAWQLQRADV